LHFTVDYGFSGEMGWSGSHHEFVINENDTVAKMIETVRKEIPDSENITWESFHHNDFHPQLSDSNKKVKECGLREGAHFDIENGMKD